MHIVLHWKKIEETQPSERAYKSKIRWRTWPTYRSIHFLGKVDTDFHKLQSDKLNELFFLGESIFINPPSKISINSLSSPRRNTRSDGCFSEPNEKMDLSRNNIPLRLSECNDWKTYSFLSKKNTIYREVEQVDQKIFHL